MAKRIGPEARIIQLFTALPDASKVIVFDVIKSQQPAKAKGARRGPSRKAAHGDGEQQQAAAASGSST